MNLKHKTYYLLILSSLFIITKVYGQYPTVKERIINLPNFDEKFLHYGYYVGVNSYDYKFEYINDYYRVNNYPDVQIESMTGFNVGLIGDIRINKYFNLRLEPGLLYSQRNLIYPDLPFFESENDLIREVKSTYIHIPLLIKMSAKRINNFKPYVTFGISSDYNLSSNSKNTDDNSSNVFRTLSKSFNYEIGLGFDFYLYYFKFSPSIRGVFSMQNELIPDYDDNSPWTSNLKNMFSRGFVINFTFE
ncbi:MAG: porin family protein [Flavobacteriaceae bacterium]|nr:porin family protein [Flavobacteriaceae bacterium]